MRMKAESRYLSTGRIPPGSLEVGSYALAYEKSDLWGSLLVDVGLRLGSGQYDSRTRSDISVKFALMKEVP